MYSHSFRATNMSNHWLVWQVHLELQLLPEKQQELMLLTLPPLFLREEEQWREERIYFLSFRMRHSLRKERIMWEGILITYPTESCKYPEISSLLFPWEGTGSARAQPSTPLPASQEIYPWAEIFLWVYQIPFVAFWDQEWTFSSFPCSLTLVFSCFAFTCPKDSLPTAKEQVKFNVIWSVNFQVETLPLGCLLQEPVLWSMLKIDHAYFTLQ